jgi:hypothetical protein
MYETSRYVYSNTQQPELSLGVHPTCSVSIMSSDPGVPDWPLASLTLNRTQYVVPGSSGAAWALQVLLPTSTDTVLLLRPPSHCVETSFHSSSYVIPVCVRGLNLTVMSV